MRARVGKTVNSRAPVVYLIVKRTSLLFEHATSLFL